MEKNISIINKLSLICIVAYLFAFFGNYFQIVGEKNSYENLYSSLLQQTSNFNSYIKENEDASSTGVEEKAKFSNATQAICFAFSKLNYDELTSFECDSTGIVNVDAMGQKVNVIIQGKQALFDSKTIYIETIRYENGSNFGQTKSVESIYKNNNKYHRETKNITKSGDSLQAIYSNPFNAVLNSGLPKNFIINEKTIVKEIYFNVNYNVYTNKISSYSASVFLNCSTAVKGYDEQMQFEGGLASKPIFQSLQINCIIDTKGYLSTMNVIESYSSSINMLGGISFTSNDNLTYYYSNYNQKLSISEPSCQ